MIGGAVDALGPAGLPARPRPVAAACGAGCGPRALGCVGVAGKVVDAGSAEGVFASGVLASLLGVSPLA